MLLAYNTMAYSQPSHMVITSHGQLAGQLVVLIKIPRSRLLTSIKSTRYTVTSSRGHLVAWSTRHTNFEEKKSRCHSQHS